MWTRRSGRRIVAVAVVVAVVAGCSTSSSTTPTGAPADSGFRPPSNGLPFANYGVALSTGVTPTNMTAEDVRAMFGDGVCADAAAGRCDLVPEAQAWLDSTNQEMAGGHCYGFSVLADLLWQGKVNVATLGAPATPGLAIDDNQRLQRLIAYHWAAQLLDSVRSKAVTGSPNKVLAKLEKVLKPNPSETYTIAIFKPDFSGGHAVTPYAVRERGGGKVDVMIYDNNWPGEARAITFDTKANTWTYLAATNPDDPVSTYAGNAKTQTIQLFPTSPGLGTQKCPFCGKVPPNAASTGTVGAHGAEEIFLLGSDTHHANLLVTDHAGHRLGFVNGRLVNEIRGAHTDELIAGGDWSNDAEPAFFVPANGIYTIKIDGRGLTSTDTETLRVIGPSFDVSVDEIPVRPGERDTLVVAPYLTRVSYHSSRVESPTLELGVSDRRADYDFVLSGVSDQPGSTITLGLPAGGGTLTMDNLGSTAPSTVNLKMTRLSSHGTQVFRHGAIRLIGGDTARLRFGGWNDVREGIPLDTIHHGQRSTQTLTAERSG